MREMNTLLPHVELTSSLGTMVPLFIEHKINLVTRLLLYKSTSVRCMPHRNCISGNVQLSQNK